MESHASATKRPVATGYACQALYGELNITHYFRLHAGAGYRWVSGVESPGVKGSDLSAFYGQITLKFGKF